LLQKDELVITTHEFLPIVENLQKFTLTIELQKFSSFIQVKDKQELPVDCF